MAEEKIKFALRMTPKEQELVREWCDKTGCRSQNEFIERAIRFYAGYLSGEAGTEYLSAVLPKAVKESLQDAEDRMARLLFKLAVEDSMVMRVLASAIEVDDGTLRWLRGKCVQDVKATRGSITLREAVKKEQQDPLPRSEVTDEEDDW